MIERVWGRTEEFIMGVLASLALLLICYEVVVRYLFPQYLTDWGFEVVIYLVVWAMLIAGSALVAEGRHIRADLVVRMLPKGGQWYIELINLIVGLLYCILVAKFALDVVLFARQLGEQSESSLQFPLWCFYLALPVSFALMAIRYLIRIYRFIFHFDESMLGEGHGNDGLEERLSKVQT